MQYTPIPCRSTQCSSHCNYPLTHCPERQQSQQLQHGCISLSRQHECQHECHCDIPLDIRHVAAKVMLGKMTAPESLLPGSFLLSFPPAGQDYVCACVSPRDYNCSVLGKLPSTSMKQCMRSQVLLHRSVRPYSRHDICAGSISAHFSGFNQWNDWAGALAHNRQNCVDLICS